MPALDGAGPDVVCEFHRGQGGQGTPGPAPSILGLCAHRWLTPSESAQELMHGYFKWKKESKDFLHLSYALFRV